MGCVYKTINHKRRRKKMGFFKASSKKDFAELFLAGLAVGSGMTLGSIIVREVISHRSSTPPPKELIDEVLSALNMSSDLHGAGGNGKWEVVAAVPAEPRVKGKPSPSND